MAETKDIIQFILTGGTIDSYYDISKDTVVPSRRSSIPAYLKDLKIYEKTVFTEVCMKDSRDLDENDRRKILSLVEKSPYKRVIITHGTYTMPDTARYLKAHLKRKDQVIVFTGSFIPLIGFTPSDAPFNLGYSIAMVQKLQPGMYVCMNGRIFHPLEVVKMVRAGKFSSIFTEK
jgi:L-asparaginase